MHRTVLLIISFFLILLTPILFGPQSPVPENVHAQTNTPPASPTPTREDKLKQLNMLMGEHSILAGQLLIARFEDRPFYDETLTAVNENSRAITLLVGDFYGDEAEEQFTSIWNRHINSFVAYADAKKNNDRNRESQAIRELQVFTEDLARLLSRGNMSLFGPAQNYFAQHILSEKRVIDSYIEEDYTAMFEAMHASYEHASMMTERLR